MSARRRVSERFEVVVVAPLAGGCTATAARKRHQGDENHHENLNGRSTMSSRPGNGVLHGLRRVRSVQFKAKFPVIRSSQRHRYAARLYQRKLICKEKVSAPAKKFFTPDRGIRFSINQLPRTVEFRPNSPLRQSADRRPTTGWGSIPAILSPSLHRINEHHGFPGHHRLCAHHRQ